MKQTLNRITQGTVVNIMENSKNSSWVMRIECWLFILSVIKRIFRALRDKVDSAHEFVCCLNWTEKESHYL